MEGAGDEGRLDAAAVAGELPQGDQPGARLQKPGSHIGTVDGITWQDFRRCFGDNADQLWGSFSNVVERRQEFHDLLERNKQERHVKATWTI